ncbi:MAG: low molecular weight phosphotyrosine protein phosphatase [Promicromonosporaceae bacterium]|nr:low molecular weight phosphotyrosine protein phosphatase [Promicromonosporaceae bacterium]
MNDPFRVMTVCTGNICRSPMAEIVLREAFVEAGLGDTVVVESTGISSEERGNPIDRRARTTLTNHGYPNGTGHVARRITPAGLAASDLVLPMTAHHARTLRRLAADAGADERTICMWRTFDPAAPKLGEGDSEDLLDVEDPWYGGMADFEVCLREIEAAIPAIVEYVKAQLG